ncbi:MAG: triose-phosphate isomerase [Alicyclobacillus sp.]|nr:triose-phosphate isomerase [Alicyclobacillus sp.]
MRRPLLMGNWKMNKTVAETRAFAEALARETSALDASADYAVCPPFTALSLAKVVFPTRVAVGAQNVHEAASGAFTGEIAAAMLKELGVTYVLIGHSERRQYFHETDAACGRKVAAVQAAGMIPVLCVGENEAERDAGETEAVVERQTEAGLAEAAEGSAIVIAYEPVWAIGTGKTPTPADAEAVIAHIRAVVERVKSVDFAASVRILYGGSVKPENIRSFTDQPNIDGALVGGASLQPESFVAMAVAMTGGEVE